MHLIDREGTDRRIDQGIDYGGHIEQEQTDGIEDDIGNQVYLPHPEVPAPLNQHHANDVRSSQRTAAF